MEKHQQLYNQYQKELEESIKAMDREEIALKEQGKDIDLILKKIEKNVADIFNKMLKVSYDNVFVKNKGAKDNEGGEFRSAYMAMFDKITTPWVQKAEKDRKFGKLEEYEKEEVKLKKAEEIKAIFNTMFKEIYGE